MGQSLNAIFWVRGVWFTNCENVNANQRAGEGNPPDARNEVRREYDGLGRLAAEYQDHDHAVVTSAQDPSPAGHSPVFRYVYGDAAHPDRLSGVMYPDGSSQWVGYGAAGSLDDRIGRVASVSLTAKGIGTAPTTPDERYEYLGLSTVVDRLRPLGGPSNGASLELSYALSGGAGDGGDQYGGLDRFGRVIEEEWVKVAANAITPIEHYRYGYDGTSDLLYKQDLVFPQMSELYHANGVAASTGTPGSSAYDFGHLWNFRRGELSASPTASRPNQVVNVFQGDQSFWSIDDAGHFARGVDDPSTPPVVAGKLSADQVGERVPVQYLPATENMPPSPKNVQAISIQFDAWGHLASVREWDLSPKPRGAAGWDYSAKPASDRPAQREYGYDALGRRIWEKIAGQPRGDLYYTPDGNVAAVYSDTQPASAYLWSPADGSLVLRDYNGERMYAQQDVAGGVTSIADAGGTPVQRFYYTPEGKVEWVSDGAGNRLGNATDLDRDGGAYKWRYLWHAQRYDGGGTYYMGPAAGGAEWDYLTAGPLKPDPSAYAAAGSAYSAWTARDAVQDQERQYAGWHNWVPIVGAWINSGIAAYNGEGWNAAAYFYQGAFDFFSLGGGTLLKAGARSALEAGSGALARRGIQVSIGIGARIGGDSAMLGLRLGGVGAGELAEASFRVGMGTGAVELAAGGIVRTGTAGPARTLLSAGGRDLAATLGRDLLAGAPAAAGRMLGYSLTDQIIQRTCFVAGTRVLMADDGEQAPPPADAPAEAQVGGWGDHVWMRGAGLLLLAAGPLGRYALSRYRRWRLRVLAEREGGGGEPPTVPLRHPSERGRPSRGVGTSAPATERLEGVFSRSAVGAPATAREG